MADVFYIKQHDLQPYYRIQIKDADGNAKDLTNATIVFTMKAQGGAIKVSRQSATITTAASGHCEYRWQSGDTDTAGAYYAEFEVTPLTGGKFTVPSRPEDAKIVVESDLDAT